MRKVILVEGDLCILITTILVVSRSSLLNTSCRFYVKVVVNAGRNTSIYGLNATNCVDTARRMGLIPPLYSRFFCSRLISHSDH